MRRTGVVVGKFLPPHRGHHHLIETAGKHARTVHVLLCTRQTDVIPGDLREAWLREVHPEAQIHVVPYDSLPDNDSQAWAEVTRQTLGFIPDVACTSEGYGETWARLLGCEHVCVDLDRRFVPVSGTQVRANPFACWEYLEPCVRAYFTIRVAVVGAESTGKTTLSEELAEALNTEWVPEYGRDYTYLKLSRYRSMEEIRWHTRDFVAIAREQQAREDAAARRANRVLVCDTDSFATAIWHERYTGRRSPAVERQARWSHIWLYFLTDVRTPFFQDGIRDGEAIREWMHNRFLEAMAGTGRPYAELSGSPERRLEIARDNVEFIMSQPFHYGRANSLYRRQLPIPAPRRPIPEAG